MNEGEKAVQRLCGAYDGVVEMLSTEEAIELSEDALDGEFTSYVRIALDGLRDDLR